MSKVVFEDPCWRIEDHNDKDVFGRKVYQTFAKDFKNNCWIFEGYRYKTTQKEIKDFQKKNGKLCYPQPWPKCYQIA